MCFSHPANFLQLTGSRALMVSILEFLVNLSSRPLELSAPTTQDPAKPNVNLKGKRTHKLLCSSFGLKQVRKRGRDEKQVRDSGL